MGAWDELDVEISVEVDTSDIDTALDLCDEYFLEDVVNHLQHIKKGVDEGSKEGVKDLAGRNRSFQEQEIADMDKHPYASGMLASSINDEEQDEYTWLIGTRINHIYPMSVEYGRSEIYPVNAKALAFYAKDGGVMTYRKGKSGVTFGKMEHGLIFRKRVGKAEPRPFVQPAFEKTEKIADEMMLRYVGRNLDK